MSELKERQAKRAGGNADFPGFADPETESDNQSFTEPVYTAPDEPKPAAGDDVMARPADAVTWTAFNTVVSALLGMGIAAVGGGFAWLHSDLSDIRTDVRDIRTDIRDSRADTRDMRSDVRDMRSSLGGVEAGLRDARASVQGLQTDIKDIRGSVASIDGRVQDAREDMLKAIGGLERQSALANARLEELAAPGRRGH
jgi:septal ring factor EnvC (AmiA/AmiB activator)